MKSVILAGGMGTRMEDICKDIPKPLLPIDEKKLIDFAIELSLSLSLEPLVVLGYKNDVLKRYLEEKWKDIKHITAIHKFKDLTLSLKAAEFYINEDFIWMGADTVFLDKEKIKRLINQNKGTKRFGLFYCISDKFTPKITLGGDNKVLDFNVEGTSGSNLSSPTIFISSKEIFSFITEGDNRNLINTLIKNNWNVYGLEYPSEKVLEVNTPQQYSELLQTFHRF